MNCSSHTLDRAAQLAYETVVESLRPFAPPEFVAVVWEKLPQSVQQGWRNAVTAALAKISEGQA